jgi:hypothetical protein
LVSILPGIAPVKNSAALFNNRPDPLFLPFNTFYQFKLHHGTLQVLAPAADLEIFIARQKIRPVKTSLAAPV